VARTVTVLGMHRSGTSAMAAALCAAGAWPGPPDALMPADDSNVRGYFERRSTVVALEGLLVALGGRWDNPPLHALDRLALEPLRDRLRQVFEAANLDLPPGQ